MLRGNATKIDGLLMREYLHQHRAVPAPSAVAVPASCSRIRSVIVLAAPHSRSAIASKNIQVAQYDTIHAYGEAARASHAVALWLERKGSRAAAVPAFIPIDMAPPTRGMQGAVDWRGAGVAAGIGGYGESGLLVTRDFGPAVRLGGAGASREEARQDRDKEEGDTEK